MSFLPANLLAELATLLPPERPSFDDTLAEAAAPATAWRSEAFAEDLPPGAPSGLRRGLQRTKVLSWMMGSKTASTMAITTKPMPTMSSGSSTVAKAIARR